jgi:hypothetical protein
MSEKQASQVLTGENAAEFYANRLGLAESPTEPVAAEETPAEPEQVEEQSEPEAEAEAKPEEEQRQNPKLKLRFSEITKQREEARKEAQRERERAAALEERLAALEGQNKPKAESVEQEPQPSQFSDAFEYAKALAEYTADKRIAEMKQQEAQQKIISQWADKVQKAKAELPDFDDIVAPSDVAVNDDIRAAMLDSDVGPQVLYHLAENQDYAKKIASMAPKAALREIGKLEARLEKVEAPAQAPVVKSKAPTPITPIRGGSAKPDVPLDSNGVFYGTAAQWKELRRAGKIR